MGDEEAVLELNRRFYEAFEQRDLETMSSLWEHGPHVSCTHPGWPTLHGWSAVVGSWYALFTNDQSLQFIVTDEHVHVVGDAAWVTCAENILEQGTGGTVAAVNLFTRAGGSWRIVGHHGGVVARQR